MKLFGRNKNSRSIKVESFSKIERQRILEGRFIPAVINNGGSHFFINLEVFEDGLIDCWEMVDLDLFKGKLNSGWVSPLIPNGKELSIHHLGSWKVKNGHWLFSKDSYYQHILSVIKDLNPELTNLYNCHGKTTKKVGKVNVSILGTANGKPYRKEEENNYFSKKHRGDNFHAFIKNNESEFLLVNINVFSDSSLQVSAVEKPETLTVEEFKEQIEQGRITTNVPVNSNVKIYGLGECTVGECLYSADINQKLNEINDIIAELNGNKTSSQICKEIYDEYCANPTVKLRDSLKIAYENIPEHLRTYVLGDMDVKDIPVKMIIYGDKEIENWSHYQVSKQEGYELPHLNVPKPNDENV